MEEIAIPAIHNYIIGTAFYKVFFNGHMMEGESGVAVYKLFSFPLCTWNPNDPCFDWKRPCFLDVELQK